MTHSKLAHPPFKAKVNAKHGLGSLKCLRVTLLRAGLSTALLAGIAGCASMQTQAPMGSAVGSTVGYGVPATDRTLAQRILDTSIVNTARANINAIDPTLHQRSRIGVDSFYSTVLLTGEVPDAATKAQVVKIVSSMPDVKQVYDRLTVGAQKGASYTVHDGYITSKLTAKIVANNAIKTSQVKVVTDDGVVYVLGKLTPTQRGHLINIVETTVGVKELVILTDLIDDNGTLIAESSVTQEVGLEPPDANAPGNPEAPIAAGVGADSRAAVAVSTLPTTIATNAPATSALTTPATPKSPTSPKSPTTPAQAPQQPTRPSTSSSGSSAYIEMYKHQVPGWQ